MDLLVCASMRTPVAISNKLGSLIIDKLVNKLLRINNLREGYSKAKISS